MIDFQWVLYKNKQDTGFVVVMAVSKKAHRTHIEGA